MPIVAEFVQRHNFRTVQHDPDDVTRLILAVTMAIGFFSFIGLLLFHGYPADNGTIIIQILGTVSTGFGMVMNYYFRKKK